MRKKIAAFVVAVLLIIVFLWSERDWQQREWVGYIVGKSHGANGNRKAIASWNATVAQWMRPLCEDEYGLEIQARMGRIDCPITMFDIDRAMYESLACGERVTIRYREHRNTHERIILAVIPLHE